MAKTDKTDAKKGKDKTKGDKKKKGDKKGAASGGVSVAGHPRAAGAVKRAKGFGGVGGFALAAYLSYKAGVPKHLIAERALMVGIAGYLVAWACAVTVWRHLVLAELRSALESGRAVMTAPEPTPAPAKDAGKNAADGE